MRILIDAGAPISQPRLPSSCAPRGDYSPLCLAISGHHEHCVSLLIASGADPFEKGLEEMAQGPAGTVSFQEKVLNLLSCSREQRLVDDARLQQLLLSEGGDEEIQRLLAFGAEPCAVGLQKRAAHGDAEMCTLLMDHGAWISTETLSSASGAAEHLVWRRAYGRLQRAAEAEDVETMIRCRRSFYVFSMFT